MAVRNAFFLFEVVVESVHYFVRSNMIIRSEFADVFSLELADPKLLDIVMPEPLPPPPAPPGKKGKKKKPKPKKKKGKKGKEPPPPPEPVIQFGQSILFTSNAECLIQTMKNNPMEVSLWSKENDIGFIGASIVTWDPIFIKYLEKIFNCLNPPAPTVKDEYNVFEEGTGKLIARLGISVKLRYLTPTVTASFRTLSEDPVIKRVLYTGMNSKTTSFICNYRTTDDWINENFDKLDSNYIVDKKDQNTTVALADYKNAPAANIAFFGENDLCCQNLADKPPESKYTAPETCPDINFIADYVRKVITSCNDNMRMLTPRPTIKPRFKATDVDRLCYCRETRWPDGDLAQRFKREVKCGPCPLCINAKEPDASRDKTLNIADITGPCGRPDCRIARDMRLYLEKQVADNNVVVTLENLIGPCGNKDCTISEKIREFIRHQGVFQPGNHTVKALSAQCDCISKMQEALFHQDKCDSDCSKDCEDDDEPDCGGKGCPFGTPQVYNVYYFTVEYNFEKNTENVENTENTGNTDQNEQAKEAEPSKQSSSTKVPSRDASKTSKTTQGSQLSNAQSQGQSENYKYCNPECPVKIKHEPPCAEDLCSSEMLVKLMDKHKECKESYCKAAIEASLVSPADSDFVVRLADIHNPCCVPSCDIANVIKEFIVDTTERNAPKEPHGLEEDPCYCDCDCTFYFSPTKTTYCGICGGYESMGTDMRDQPDFLKPHPCPIYHKLYDRTLIHTKSPWPEDEKEESVKEGIPLDAQSIKSAKAMSSCGVKLQKKPHKKKVSKYDLVPCRVYDVPEKKPILGKCIPKDVCVPKDMGWLWNAEDIPGLKFRPKWKPGAAHKLLVRRYKSMREGVDTIKKKRAMMNRKKKIEAKPALVVKKTDGEYTVQMEVFKKYSNERLIHQYPYDEKPPLIYTIGKTEEEKRKIQKKRERRERRESRRKCRLLQSTFRDKCQEICLKAYNQAMGILPLPNANDPDCPCDTQPVVPSPIIDSCSCSDSVSITSSDTDGDDWIIEFTPPSAKWDAKAKHTGHNVSNDTQYTYLDYKVKILDKQGNQVPRYFTALDGSQQCSDLGGFWQEGPPRVWLEINKDGYIGPDGRWVPHSFIGPDGTLCLPEDGGTVTDSNGNVYKIGIDGYIDSNNKWAWYGRQKKQRGDTAGTGGVGASTTTVTTVKTSGKKQDVSDSKGAKDKAKPDKKSQGDKANVNKKQKQDKKDNKDNKDNKDKKAAAPKGAAPRASPDKHKEPKVVAIVPPRKTKHTVVNLAMHSDRFDSMKRPHGIYGMHNSMHGMHGRHGLHGGLHGTQHNERLKAADLKKQNRYREIMQGLRIYDDLCVAPSPPKASRASNTPRRKLSLFTMEPCKHLQPDHEQCLASLPEATTSSSFYNGSTSVFLLNY